MTSFGFGRFRGLNVARHMGSNIFDCVCARAAHGARFDLRLGGWAHIALIIFLIAGTGFGLSAHAQAPNQSSKSLVIPDLPCMTPDERAELEKLAADYASVREKFDAAVARLDAIKLQKAEVDQQISDLEAERSNLDTDAGKKLIGAGFVDKDASAKLIDSKLAGLRNRRHDLENQINAENYFLYIEGKWLRRYRKAFDELVAKIKKSCPPPQATPSRVPGRPFWSLASNETHFGLFVGGAMVTGLPTASSSGFFTGNLDNTPAAWGVGGSLFYDFAHFGTSSAPFSSVVLSTGLVVDYFSGASLQYHGGCGGFACTGTGGLSELNYIFEVKATTPLSPGNTINGYIGAGGATLFPTGQPTGFGGPNFLGSATAPAFRVGWGVDHQLDMNWSAGFKIGFQHTGSTEYDTTLAGERFRIDHKNEVLFGATFAYTLGP